MPNKQLQQPEKLETLATAKIIQWIILHYKEDTIKECKADLMSKKIETVRSYFEHIPKLFCNDLLAELISNISREDIENTECSSIEEFRCIGPFGQRKASSRWIEVLFSKDITSLSLTYDEFYRFSSSLRSKSHLLTQLTTLNLFIERLYFVIDSMYSDFTEFFKRIPNLKHLIISCSNDKVLRHIIDNCKSITKLDLRNFFDVSPKTYDVICRLPNLETVCLFDFSENYFFHPRQNDHSKSSIYKYILDIHTQKQFELKSYILTDGGTVNDMEVIKKYPMIESFTLVNSSGIHTLEFRCESLSVLKNVQELEISYYSFYTDKVKEVIDLMGGKIEKLRLLNVSGIDLQALEMIGKMCPNLKELTLGEAHFALDNPVSSDQRYSIENPIFKNLERLDISFSHNHYRSINDLTKPSPEQLLLLSLIENCPNIEDIDICQIELTKDFMLEVLNRNPLRCLIKLRVVRKLEQSTIDRILEIGLSPKISYWWK